jgi:ketosteroid isomerase-like protein
MPARDLVQRFVDTVREGRFVDAIAEYYAPQATMRENLAPPRGGRGALIEQEKSVLARHRSVRTLEADPVLVDGETVVIRWVFEFTTHDGAVRRMEELALQTWRDDRIIAEQFYYDPGQFAPPAGP